MKHLFSLPKRELLREVNSYRLVQYRLLVERMYRDRLDESALQRKHSPFENCAVNLTLYLSELTFSSKIVQAVHKEHCHSAG